MAALRRSLVLFALLGAAQALVDPNVLETLKSSVKNSLRAHMRMKEKWNELSSAKIEIYDDIQKEFREILEVADFPLGHAAIEGLQIYSDMSARLLDQMLMFLQTQTQETGILLENNLEYVKILEQQQKQKQQQQQQQYSAYSY